MKVYYCKLIANDFFYFVSFDENTFGKPSAIIHNYALSFAFNYLGFSTTTPQYEKHLENINYIPTPANLVYTAGEVIHTYNFIDTRTNLTAIKSLKTKNFPNFGKYLKYLPYTTFECFLFSKNDKNPPGIIRIGKKMSPFRVIAQELSQWKLLKNKPEVLITHPLNPIDLIEEQEIINFKKIYYIPPSPIIIGCKVKSSNEKIIICDQPQNKWKKFYIYVPNRLMDEFT